MGSVSVPKVVIWEAWGVLFGTLVDHFIDLKVFGDNSQESCGPGLDFHRFGVDLETLLGPTLDSFCDFLVIGGSK